MAGNPGRFFVLLGLALILGTIVGFPFLDKAVPCGFLDLSCASGRFLLFWVLTLLGVLATGAGIFIAAKGPAGGGEFLDLSVEAGRGGVRGTRRLAGKGISYARARRKG